MANPEPIQTQIKLLSGHAISVVGDGHIWLREGSWGGFVAFDAYAGIVPSDRLELGLPSGARHVVGVTTRQTKKRSRSATATELRFEGFGRAPKIVAGQRFPPAAENLDWN